MGLTRAAVRRRVLDNYRLSGEPPKGLTSDWLNDAIADADRYLAEATECIEGTASILTTASTRNYTYTTEFIKIDRVAWGTGRRDLDLTTRDELHVDNGDGWILATGTVEKWYLEGHRRFCLYPIPATGSGCTAFLYGPRYPAALSADGSTSELPTALDRARVEYVCRELAGLDENSPPQREVRFDGRFRAEVAKYLTNRPVSTVTRFVGPGRF